MSIRSCQNFYNEIHQLCNNPYLLETRPFMQLNSETGAVTVDETIINVDTNNLSDWEKPLERYVISQAHADGRDFVNYSLVLWQVTDQEIPPLMPENIALLFHIDDPVNQNDPQPHPLRYRKVSLVRVVHPLVHNIMNSAPKRKIAAGVNCILWGIYPISSLARLAFHVLAETPATILKWTTKMVISIAVSPFATLYIGFRTYDFKDTHRNERMAQVSLWINTCIPSEKFFKVVAVLSSSIVVALAVANVVVIPPTPLFLIGMIAFTILGTLTFSEHQLERIWIAKPLLTPRQIWNNALRQHVYSICKYRNEECRQAYAHSSEPHAVNHPFIIFYSHH